MPENDEISELEQLMLDPWNAVWYEDQIETAKEGCFVCRQPFRKSDELVGDPDGWLAHMLCGTFDPEATGDFVWVPLADDTVEAIRQSLPE